MSELAPLGGNPAPEAPYPATGTIDLFVFAPPRGRGRPVNDSDRGLDRRDITFVMDGVGDEHGALMIVWTRQVLTDRRKSGREDWGNRG